MEKIFTQRFFVSANEANAQGILAAPILVTGIIDIATRHANSLHIGNPDMTDTGGGWVLSRLTVEMYRWPEVNTEYTITTWIEGWNRRFSERVFRIDDSRGNLCGYARTIWMVINTVTHAPLSLEHLHLAPQMIDGSAAPIERQVRHIPLLAPGDQPTMRQWLPATEKVRKYRFKYSDIDYYRHVNTVRYLVLLLNQFTLAEMDAHPLRRIEMSFMREAHYDMTVDILCHRDGPTAIFSLCPEGAHASPLLFARIMHSSGS